MPETQLTQTVNIFGGSLYLEFPAVPLRPTSSAQSPTRNTAVLEREPETDNTWELPSAA